MAHGVRFIDSSSLKMAFEKRGIDGAAITNFHEIADARRIAEELPEYAIIPGQEISTSEGHILALWTEEEIANGLSPEKTLELIHAQKAFAVAPHPFLHLGLGRKFMDLPFDAVEVYNGVTGSFFFFNFMTGIAAKRTKLPCLASTDTSSPEFVGYSYTEVLTDDPAKIRETVTDGKVIPHKRAVPMPLNFMLKGFLNFNDIDIWEAHAMPCPECGKSNCLRILKKNRVCIGCGKTFLSRVECSNGHFFCYPCLEKRSLEKIRNRDL